MGRWRPVPVVPYSSAFPLASASTNRQIVRSPFVLPWFCSPSVPVARVSGFSYSCRGCCVVIDTTSTVPSFGTRRRCPSEMRSGFFETRIGKTAPRCAGTCFAGWAFSACVLHRGLDAHCIDTSNVLRSVAVEPIKFHLRIPATVFECHALHPVGVNHHATCGGAIPSDACGCISVAAYAWCANVACICCAAWLIRDPMATAYVHSITTQDGMARALHPTAP